MTKVLVFESDASFAGELRNELGKLGCTTAVVDDGNAGLQAAAADKPDLILLSIELPRMNGFSVCNKLKKDLTLKDVPLIIMSSESSDETFEQHRKLRTRAEDYVHKPIAFGELLQHIRTFVQIGGSGQSSMPPSDIVIDDEIQIMSVDLDDEATVMAPRPQLPQLSDPNIKGMSGVDADVDAFIEGGFGRLQSKSAPPPALPANGVGPDGPTQQLPKRGRSAAPPPLPVVDNSKFEELERELSAAREEAAKLRAEFDSKIEAEQQKMEREMDELRSKLASAATGKGGGVSSREFLDLREALNKKDKEILALKESLSKKDKEIFETRDKALVLERAKGELDDRLLVIERELEGGREKLEGLTRDRDQAKKAGDDFKTRLGKTQADLETRDRELEESRTKAKEQAAAHDAAIAAANTEHAAVVARMEAEKAAAIAEAATAVDAAREDSAKDKASALADALAAAATERASAISAREAELKSETDSKLASLYRAHQEELGKHRNEHAQALESLSAKHASEGAVAQAAHEEQLATTVAELEARRAADVAAVEQDRDEKLAALGAERDGRIALLERNHAEKVASVERDRDERLTALTKERDDTLAEISADRDARVAAAESDRDEKIATLTTERNASIATLEVTAASLSGDLADLREKKAAADAANEARISALESDLAKARAELSDLSSRKAAEDAAHDAHVADLDARIAAAAQAKDGVDKELSSARDRIAALEAESAAQRADLSDTRSKLASEAARAEKAFAKWESDKASLDRAKDALAVALAQIEEAEGRLLG